MGERFSQDLGRWLKWLLIGLTYLDPMALSAYRVAVMQAGVDHEQEQTRARPERLASKEVSAANPNTGPIADAGFSTQIRTPSAIVSAEVA